MSIPKLVTAVGRPADPNWVSDFKDGVAKYFPDSSVTVREGPGIVYVPDYELALRGVAQVQGATLHDQELLVAEYAEGLVAELCSEGRLDTDEVNASLNLSPQKYGPKGSIDFSRNKNDDLKVMGLYVSDRRSKKNPRNFQVTNELGVVASKLNLKTRKRTSKKVTTPRLKLGLGLSAATTEKSVKEKLEYLIPDEIPFLGVGIVKVFASRPRNPS